MLEKNCNEIDIISIHIIIIIIIIVIIIFIIIIIIIITIIIIIIIIIIITITIICNVRNSKPQPQRNIVARQVGAKCCVCYHSLRHQDMNEHFVFQINLKGDSTICCARSAHDRISCGGALGICRYFYDTAPSGRFGTMTYFSRALANRVSGLPHMPECVISWLCK